MHGLSLDSSTGCCYGLRMEDLPQPVHTSHARWIERLQAIVEILLLSGLFSTPLAAAILSAFYRKKAEVLTNDATMLCVFLLVEAGITLLILTVILKAHRETICSLGLKRDRWKFYLLAGFGLVPFFFLINAIAEYVFRVYLPQYNIERNPLFEIIHSPGQLAFFIISALIAGGIKEELQRAFILTRFGRFLGGAWIGLVLWSFAFGAGHYVQGIPGITIATLYGFIFGIVYLLSGSLIAPMVSHGAYDTLALLAYWFVSGQSH